MRSIFASIRKRIKRGTCYLFSAGGFVGSFLFMTTATSSLLNDNFTKGFCLFFAICYLLFGIVFLLAGLHDVKPEPLRYFTVNEDGKTVLTDVDTILAKPSVNYKETRRADGKFDVFMQVRSKEQAVEVLAALAVMYDKGDISTSDFQDNVHKIREHFHL